ncbi:MAG: hypothetical protein JNL74_14295 [Fibrobacteres bacterium]|nr:hypothetical protein [Fibrobacterota bacterium]
MKSVIVLFSLIFSVFICSCDDEQDIDTDRDLNFLELKLIGTWCWSKYGQSDTLTFFRDFSYSGKMNGERYSGKFNLTLDSVMTMLGSTNYYGAISTDYIKYVVHRLNETSLVLSAASREEITYRKTP